MTEQQHRIVADRAIIGDKIDFETWDADDLLVYRYPGRGNNPGELVRIERPVPTTDEDDPDDEEFCARCYAGVDSSEHHEKCVVTGHAVDGESASWSHAT